MKKKPNLEHVRVFGSEAFALLPKQQLKKFGWRAKKLWLIGYVGESSNYKLFCLTTKKVTVSRYVDFNELHDEITGTLQESLELEMDWLINEHLEVREVNDDAPGAVEVPQVDEQVREEPPAGNATRPEIPSLPASLRNLRDI